MSWFDSNGPARDISSGDGRTPDPPESEGKQQRTAVGRRSANEEEEYSDVMTRASDSSVPTHKELDSRWQSQQDETAGGLLGGFSPVGFMRHLMGEDLADLATAQMVTSTLLNPLDRVHRIKQVAPELLRQKRVPSMDITLKGQLQRIVATEGISGLWRGNGMRCLSVPVGAALTTWVIDPVSYGFYLVGASKLLNPDSPDFELDLMLLRGATRAVSTLATATCMYPFELLALKRQIDVPSPYLGNLTLRKTVTEEDLKQREKPRHLSGKLMQKGEQRIGFLYKTYLELTSEVLTGSKKTLMARGRSGGPSAETSLSSGPVQTEKVSGNASSSSSSSKSSNVVISWKHLFHGAGVCCALQSLHRAIYLQAMRSASDILLIGGRHPDDPQALEVEKSRSRFGLAFGSALCVVISSLIVYPFETVRVRRIAALHSDRRMESMLVSPESNVVGNAYKRGTLATARAMLSQNEGIKMLYSGYWIYAMRHIALSVPLALWLGVPVHPVRTW